jgi:hypothetical protein
VSCGVSCGASCGGAGGGAVTGPAPGRCPRRRARRRPAYGPRRGTRPRSRGRGYTRPRGRGRKTLCVPKINCQWPICLLLWWRFTQGRRPNPAMSSGFETLSTRRGPLQRAGESCKRYERGSSLRCRSEDFGEGGWGRRVEQMEKGEREEEEKGRRRSETR